MHSSDIDGRIAGLYLHPVKSCAPVAVDEARVAETGLEFDREWMVVDADACMLTQRTEPRLALVRPRFFGDELVLRAPGMLALHLRLDAVESPTRVRVWNDEVRAYDMGALAAQWFTDLLGRPLRLARFDPEEQRLSDRRWTGELAARNAFSDAFPLLVASTASLAALNERLAARGAPAVEIERFRPNLVLAGLEAFDEDHLADVEVAGADGPVTIRLVKPCVRCSIPNVDPASAEVGSEPGATLATFRADPRMDGGLTFAMNAVIVDGVGRRLGVGDAVAARFAL